MTTENNKIISNLKALGLSPSEIDTYLASVALSVPQTSGILAKRANLRPSTTTMALQSLIRKGIMSSYEDNKGIYYSAENPSSLLKVLERKQCDLEILKKKTESIIPLIQSSISPFIAKPKIKVYEGIDGIKQVFLSMMDLDDQIYGYASMYEEIDNLFAGFWREYFKRVVAKNKFVKMIIPNSSAGQFFAARDQYENRETLLIPEDRYLFGSEKHIVGDTIAHILMQNDALIAVVIQNNAIAQSEKQFFQLIWNTFKDEI